MAIIICPNMHYYDNSEYAECPYCKNDEGSADMEPLRGQPPVFEKEGDSDRTVGLQFWGNKPHAGSMPEEDESDKTVGLESWGRSLHAGGMPEEDESDKTVGLESWGRSFHAGSMPEEDESDKTVGLESLNHRVQDIAEEIAGPAGYSAESPSEKNRAEAAFSKNAYGPVVGWLVCTEGCCYGMSFNIYSGRNTIGRNLQNDICLEGDPLVSREKHAEIVYSPESRIFYAYAGDSHGLLYVNDELILESTVLNDRDMLEIGQNKLVFVPFCTKSFAWNMSS